MFPELTRDDVFRIETARLWLRWPRAKDVPAFARIGARRVNLAGEGMVLAIAPRNDPSAFLGIVGVQAKGNAALALGYWLGRPFWGQGLMREAMAGVIDMAFVLGDAVQIETPVPPPDSPAARVLARVGFPPADRDGRFVIARQNWLAARADAAERIALPQAAA